MDYVLGPPPLERNGGVLLRLADDIRKCVVYFGHPKTLDDGREDLEPQGTGFFVAHSGATYLVTAKHVAESLSQTPFAVRLNSHVGGFRIEHIDIANWALHPDSDVAAVQMDIPAWADCKPYADYLLSTFKMETKNIGTGDLVYIVGLFNLMHGNEKNLPFVHTGHIGMLPEDQRVTIYDTTKRAHVTTDGLLVEGQALSGASGSPVFVRRSLPFDAPSPGGNRTLRAWVHGSVWLLGVWSSSYVGSPSAALAQYKQIDSNKKVPYGVGVVVPAQKIIEVLEMPELKEARKKETERRSRAMAPTTDSLPASTSENPRHKEDFTRLVGAAAKTKRPAE